MTNNVISITMFYNSGFTIRKSYVKKENYT